MPLSVFVYKKDILSQRVMSEIRFKIAWKFSNLNHLILFLDQGTLKQMCTLKFIATEKQKVACKTCLLSYENNYAE